MLHQPNHTLVCNETFKYALETQTVQAIKQKHHMNRNKKTVSFL